MVVAIGFYRSNLSTTVCMRLSLDKAGSLSVKEPNVFRWLARRERLCGRRSCATIDDANYFGANR